MGQVETDQSDTLLRRIVGDSLPYEKLAIELLKLQELITGIRKKEMFQRPDICVLNAS